VHCSGWLPWQHAYHAHQVWKIEDFLTKWEATCSGGSTNSSATAATQDPGKAAIALVLLKEIDTYRSGSGAMLLALVTVDMLLARHRCCQ